MATYHQVPQDQVFYGSDVELTPADIAAIEMEPVGKEGKKALKRAKKLAKKQEKKENKKVTSCEGQKCRERCRQKMRKAGRHAVNCCACWGCFSCLSFLVMTLVLMGAWSHLAHQVDECVHPKHSELSAFQVDPKVYKSLSIDLTFGQVKVYAVDPAKQPHITLAVTKRSKIKESLSKVVASLTHDGASASLTIETHSMSFRDCAQAEVEIYVPIGTNTEISATVAMGDVEIIEVPKTTLKSVNAFVHAGVIRMNEVHTEDVNLETRLGLVNAASVTSTKVSVTTQTGAALLKSIVSHNVNVQTDTGDVEIHKMQLPVNSGSLVANCNLGHLRMQGVTGGSKIDLKTTMGVMEVYFDKTHPFSGAFEASAPKGDLRMVGSSDPLMQLALNEKSHVKGTIKGASAAPRLTTLATPVRQLTVTSEEGRIALDLLGLEEHENCMDNEHKHHHHHHHHHHGKFHNKHHHHHHLHHKKD